jgi:hypothetical protein
MAVDGGSGQLVNNWLQAAHYEAVVLKAAVLSSVFAGYSTVN